MERRRLKTIHDVKMKWDLLQFLFTLNVALILTPWSRVRAIITDDLVGLHVPLTATFLLDVD